MKGVTIELKARCPNPVRIRAILRSRRAIFKGLDRQSDTHFCVPCGRLKLREGRIENALIHYRRANQKDLKRCDAFLYKCRGAKALKKILKMAFGILAIVDKTREIYFLGNVKFHIDCVKKLGSFVEIEAFGGKGLRDMAGLRKQCHFYQDLLGISKKDLLADSYSDQILRRSR